MEVGNLIIKWKEEYSLGIDMIDQQHQKLFEIAGRAYELLKDELRIDKYDEIVAILEELKDYAAYHFQSEEEYMKSIGYRKYLSHKVRHDDFLEKVNSIDLYQLDHQQDQYLLEILEFMVNWIDKHILGEDKQYVS